MKPRLLLPGLDLSSWSDPCSQVVDTVHPRLIARQISLLIYFDLPTIPPPTTTSPFRYDRFSTLLHRRSLPRLSPGQTLPVEGNAVARSRVRTSPGASPTGLAESSSHTLRTGRSSQVALHLSSRKRSYHFRLQAGNVSLRGTSTLQIKRLHRRTSRHAPRRLLKRRWGERVVFVRVLFRGFIVERAFVGRQRFARGCFAPSW